jgi:hypothetical protein
MLPTVPTTHPTPEQLDVVLLRVVPVVVVVLMVVVEGDGVPVVVRSPAALVVAVDPLDPAPATAVLLACETYTAVVVVLAATMAAEVV